MLLLFNENLPQNKQHFDRVFYKWISCYCTYYFLNAYVFEPLLCGSYCKNVLKLHLRLYLQRAKKVLSDSPG